jgi:hypothetical protein
VPLDTQVVIGRVCSMPRLGELTVEFTGLVVGAGREPGGRAVHRVRTPVGRWNLVVPVARGFEPEVLGDLNLAKSLLVRVA